MIRIFLFLLVVHCFGAPNLFAETKTVSVLTIGNSFAENALKHLPQLAKSAGHNLIVGRANLGGCSLERHWNHVTKFEADSESKEGSPYGKGKRSLDSMLRSRQWDYITIQQVSMKSHDISTYYPFVRDLVKYIRERAPDSKLMIHQIWAYRVDDPRFSPDDKENGPSTQKEMYEQVRHAYHTVGDEFKLGILPSGDAMFLADTDPERGYKPTTGFDPPTAVHPKLPEQKHSLHTGWRWNKGKSGKLGLRLDGHHANRAGEYLIGCTWFEVLFGESVVDNSFVPAGLDSEYAAFLRETAHRAVKNP